MTFGPGGHDLHIDSVQTKEEVMGDLIRASEQLKAMGRGKTPAGVESLLQELKTPTLTPHDIIINAFQRKTRDEGVNNDWTRFERRPSFISERGEDGVYKPVHKLYRPVKHTFTPKWIAMIDTSGSMGDKDIANGMKELQIVASFPGNEGYVIPCDAVPYWDKITRITDKSDIRKTAIVGRGGTVFAQFFLELPKKLGTDFDVIVIITDGWCDQIPMSLKPPCDVLWIITSNFEDFKPTFGRVAILKDA